ncbi:MAG TPA: hypothetical protein VNU94_09690 [Acidobacteriaceae bacterium]|jgi:hypothetical protein|nr:hypothetical protein [Acidobacteriaceae bacterium]
MKIYLEWQKQVQLKSIGSSSAGYQVNFDLLPPVAGVYLFGRIFDGKLEVLYVGQAANLKSRIKGQLNNLRLMNHIKNAKNGKKVLVIGILDFPPGPKNPKKSLDIAEKSLIRHYLSEGHDISNKMGVKFRTHRIESFGTFGKKNIPGVLHLEVK